MLRDYILSSEGGSNILYQGPGFSTLVVDIWGYLIFCWSGGRPVHCRTFNSIPGRWPLDDSITLLVEQPEISSGSTKWGICVLGEKLGAVGSSCGS